jgi:hypothetical protein
MTRRELAVASLLVCWCAPGLAQTPAGDEFRANDITTGYQLSPALAVNRDGSFVVAFTATDVPGNYGVWVKRYDARGGPLGFETRANSYSYSYQGQAAVAGRPSGDFVVVWHSYYQDGDGNGIAGQRFDAAGARRGEEFVVNTYVTGYQEYPGVAALEGQGFVVVWRSQWGGGLEPRVLARVYDADGDPRGEDFQVNPRDGIAQFGSAVASDGRGRFVVVYSNQEDLGSDSDVYGQLFDASGVRLGAEFAVNSYTTGRQGGPAAAMAADGRFVVVWSSAAHDGLRARRFAADGTPQGGELVVNTYTTGFESYTSIAADAAGNFIVAWTSTAQDGSDAGVFARRFDSNGAPRGSEFRVNSFTTGRQMDLKVASDESGNFIGAWASLEQDGSGDGVFVQRYGGLVPAALAVDPQDSDGSNGNGVFEPGETITALPAWRNVNGQAQAFAGSASAFTGPAGPVYSLMDAVADYGTVADGARGSCADTANCYVMAVQALHWDATVREALSPDRQGQLKEWRLHVGGSFSDVAATGTFYPFIEVLLHHGVTAGCRASEYCPADSVTRQQMAVFVLLSREGPSYVPPACGVPVFDDVSAASPFCPWIEDLARRGVVGGCGGGRYCPTGAVTRAEMAVFALATREAPGYAPPPCLAPAFDDVPSSSVFCPWIAELARRGIVSGCGDGDYCPGRAVTRAEIGVFLAGTFGLALYGP